MLTNQQREGTNESYDESPDILTQQTFRKVFVKECTYVTVSWLHVTKRNSISVEIFML
jgi:hypothetical protein